ncbi:MAG: thioredoxin family protein [Pontiellaceae bacterium]|jgi:thiol:disulfide interchange protein|nr:thioredoxin family protein [Pontiellaceae bacterium]
MKKLILFSVLFTLALASAAQSPETNWAAALEKFDVTCTGSGYMDAPTFSEFMDRAEGRGGEQQVSQGFTDNPLGFFEQWGFWRTLLLILIGGLALNLTPCVLPMIPVNLAIIGAGAQSKSRKKGFALGSAYGLGITVVYGVLGLSVVLGGAQFGALNASPWFNLSIAAVFVVLALAMFDLFHIDFSRFQQRFGSRQGGNSYFAAFSIGGISALLAGACVAPVVIAVLLLAGSLYAQGVAAGLVLPFVLGLGMALPWPFAGAGLSFLPKPGGWMEWVKRGFGLLILLFAVYYGLLGARLMKTGTTARSDGEGEHAVFCDTAEGFSALLNEAAAEKQSVFIDFWAEWCKNCLAMDSITFKNPDIQKRMERYRVIKFDATRSGESPASEILDHFSVVGLPTYIILTPKR